MSADRACRARLEPGARRERRRGASTTGRPLARSQAPEWRPFANVSREPELCARGGLAHKGRRMPPPTPPRIFDRDLINRRLDRAWARQAGDARADFLLARAAQDLGERLSLVKRRFAVAADFGSPGPHGAVALAAGGQVDCVVRIAPTQASLGTGDFLPAVGDLERLPVGGWPPRPRRLAPGAADRERSAGRAGSNARAR